MSLWDTDCGIILEMVEVVGRKALRRTEVTFSVSQTAELQKNVSMICSVMVRSITSNKTPAFTISQDLILSDQV